MTRAGAGFVPCEVPYPARVLTAYPCVVRRDPTVRGTFPSESKSETVSPGWLGKRGVDPMPTVFVLLFPHPGATHPFASERARTCDVGGAAGLCTCHEGRGPGLRNLVRHEAGPCAGHGECYRSNHPRSNHVTTSGGHTLAAPLIEGPGEKRAHCIPMWRAPGDAHPQPRPLLLANQECPHLRRPGLPPLLLGVAPFAGFALV